MTTLRIGLFCSLMCASMSLGQAKITPAGSNTSSVLGSKFRLNVGSGFAASTSPGSNAGTGWQNAPTPPVAPVTPANPTAQRGFTILYDWAPTSEPMVANMLERARAQPFILVYQNIDPAAAQTGLIDANKIIADVRRRHGNNPTGWGMLDYEAPFDSILHAGRSHPKYAECVKTMVDAVRAVKQAFPNVKWTYYGIPGLTYWPGGSLWSKATPAQRQAEIDRQIECHGPVLAELDWYSPCVYDVYRHDRLSPDAKIEHVVNEREYRIGRISVVRQFLRRNNLPSRPIIPSVCPFYAPGGNAGDGGLIPRDELVRDQILPLIAAQCDGMAIWTAGSYFVLQATRATEPGNDTQRQVRDIYRTAFLGGVEPTTWSSDSMRSMLTRRVGNVIGSMAYYGREAARLKKLDTATAAANPP